MSVNSHYPLTDLTHTLALFWGALSSDQRRRIGVNVAMIIGTLGDSSLLMQTIQNQVNQVAPRATNDFNEIMQKYRVCTPEIRQTADQQLTQYFLSRNR